MHLNMLPLSVSMAAMSFLETRGGAASAGGPSAVSSRARVLLLGASFGAAVLTPPGWFGSLGGGRSTMGQRMHGQATDDDMPEPPHGIR